MQSAQPSECRSERSIRLRLMIRLVFYWATMWLFILCVPLLVRIFLGRPTLPELFDKMLNDWWFAFAISSMLIPFFALDWIRLRKKIADSIEL